MLFRGRLPLRFESISTTGIAATLETDVEVCEHGPLIYLLAALIARISGE